MDVILALAKTTYNQAFDLVEAGEGIKALELAATSLHLWRQVGTDQNVAIGLWLYSRALVGIGAETAATEAATESVRLAKLDGTDWLIASALEGLARATRNTTDFETNRALAAEAIAAIADSEDRALIESQFADLR
ncbi:MAG: hypothetical protein RL196_598 [Actinomycetota bacterium]